MAHVSAVTVGELAGRRSRLEFELHPHVNVFWGVNGSGKTSLLRIVHGALRNDASSLARAPFSSARVEIRSGTRQPVIRTIEKPSSLQEEILSLGRIEEADQTDSNEGLADSEQQFEVSARELRWKTSPAQKDHSALRYAHQYLPISRMSEASARRTYVGPREPSLPLDDESLDRTFAEQTQILWRDYYTKSLMDIRRVQERGLADILSGVLKSETAAGRQSEGGPRVDSAVAFQMVREFFDSQHLSPDLGTYEEFAVGLENSRTIRKIVSEIVEVQDAVTRIQRPQAAVEELLSLMLGGRKKVSFNGRSLTIRSGRSKVPLASLSSGEKQIIRLLLECIAARGNCVLIDEPELSLHVDWQHRLIEGMRTINPRAQLVVATHSPEIMANVPDESIFEL